MDTPEQTDAPQVIVTFRIPGRWDGPEDFAGSLPSGCGLEEGTLTLEDGVAATIIPAAPDDEFAALFEASCRRPPPPAEMQAVRDYTVNIILRCVVGSPKTASDAMRAAATVVDAGGGGVFIDNCGLAHSASDWLMMAEDATLDAITFAYVGMIADAGDVTTLGMHIFGRPDFIMTERDAGEGLEGELDPIIQVMQYLVATDREVDVGHVIAGEDGSGFRIAAAEPAPMTAGSSMHNPFGRWRLISLRDIAASN